MTQMDMKRTARSLTVNSLAAVLEELGAVQFADASYAVLQEVDGQEVWTEITVKAKSFTPTKTSPAFDPFVTAEEWKTDKEIKAKEKEEKEKAKAAKLAAKVKKEAEEEVAE